MFSNASHLETDATPKPTIVSPPANHPFMRPAMSSTPSPSTTLQPSGSYHYQSQTSDRGSLRRPPSASSAAPSSSYTRPMSQAHGASSDLNHNGNANGGAWADPAEPRKLSRWEEKVQGDLAGWRGGHGTPRSSVPHGSVPQDTYFGQPRTGNIGHDLPKEIVRIERDWSLGDICQFSTAFPLELESRIQPSVFSEFMESINRPLVEAYSVRGAVIDNLIAVATWWTSLIWRTSHFESNLRQVEELIREANKTTFNPVGLNVLSPRPVALQYLEIEYY